MPLAGSMENFESNRRSEENGGPEVGIIKLPERESRRASKDKVQAPKRSAGQTPLTLWFKPKSAVSVEVNKTKKDSTKDPCNEGKEAHGPAKETEGVVARCFHCPREFQTTRGRSQHIRLAHPLEANASTQQGASRKRARWSSEERRVVAEAEARLWRAGVPSEKIMGKLVESFTSRSRYSLQGVRRHGQYQSYLAEAKNKLGQEIVQPNQNIMGGPDGSPTKTRTDSELISETGGSEGSPTTTRTRNEDSNSNKENHPAGTDHQTGLPEWKAHLKTKLKKEVTKASFCVEFPHRLDKEFSRWLKGVAPNRRRFRSQIPNRPIPTGNRYRRRKQLRAAWLRSYEKNPARTSRRIIEGRALEERTVYPPGMTEFWKNVFETKAAPGGRVKKNNWAEQDEYGLLAPISEDEVRTHLRTMRSGAAGTDGITLTHLRSFDVKALAEWFNCFILLGKLPKALKYFRTIFIPKNKDPTEPGGFRPITIGPYVRRLFTGMVAKRMRRVPTHFSQRGFKCQEGTAINQLILRAIVDGHINKIKPLRYVFLDVSKAFDSVAHERLEVAYKQAGLPVGVGKLFADMYRSNSTKLDGVGETIRIRRGVLQGDPLSPIIFNLVMDVVVQGLDPAIGGCLHEQTVPSLLFADDAVLLAKTAEGLQSNVDRFVRGLEFFGLNINANKSAAVQIGVDGRAKKWFVDDRPRLNIKGDKIRTLRVGQGYKYLGLRLSTSKCITDVLTEYTVMTENIDKCVLKPQHKLSILKFHCIPKIQYALDLGEVSIGTLRDVDRRTRKMIKKWCHLPKDVPVSMIHSSLKDGGLGVPSMRTRIPRLRQDRRKRITEVEEPDPLIWGLQATKFWTDHDTTAVETESDIHEFMQGRSGEKNYWRKRLYSTVDGEGLRSHAITGLGSKFFFDSFLKLSGREFISALHLRCGTLRTPARSNRGRLHGKGPNCPACPDKTATLGHLLQNCGRTHLARVKRHDEITKLLACKLRKLQFEVELEPHIPVGSSHLKPDLVAFRRRDRMLMVLDPTIVNCKSDINLIESEKADKYVRPEVFNWLEQKYGPSGQREHATIGGVVINFRGGWSPRSVELLKAMGVRPGFLEFLSFQTLKWGRFIYSTLRDRTS